MYSRFFVDILIHIFVSMKFTRKDSTYKIKIYIKVNVKQVETL